MKPYPYIQSVAIVFFLFAFSCCSSLNVESVEDGARLAAIKAAAPVLEKLLRAEAPIVPSGRTLYPTVPNLPGKPFTPWKEYKRKIQLTKEGTLLLRPGDYVFPVMTYCMKSVGTSPSTHRYTLGQLQGKMADIITALNNRAIEKNIPYRSIQVLSWAIQNGLTYEEFSDEMRVFVDLVLPEFRDRLHQSVWTKAVTEWDSIAGKTGIVPKLGDLSDKALKEMGDTGEVIRNAKEFRKLVREYSIDSSNFKDLISTPGESPSAHEPTPWSQLSPSIFARFQTKGIYQQVGWLEVRVVEDARKPAARESIGIIPLNIGALIADPGNGTIQPLSFSALSGIVGIGLISTEASPLLIVAALAGILATTPYVDWDAFTAAAIKFEASANKVVQDLIRSGNHSLSKEHDKLEKPARNFGIIDGNSKEMPHKNSQNVKEWTNKGGAARAEKDFKDVPGEAEQTSKPEVKTKTLPNGDKIVYRLPENDKPATIEIQPKDTWRKNPIRIKVRYP